ncbi:MAG TPA: response regulator [Desulfuromonadales bacterium]|nr:response regulator [Desulfuromonadales bacterium]
MSIKLLVADDSITIQKVIGIIFGGDDYSLTVVDNGKAAVEKAREICPDVLLIDALMPGMSGYEVSEAVRGIPEIADKPILILTGSFEPFDEDKARKCGADDFMAKPFESQQIVNKVKELAEIGASRSRSVAPPPQAPAQQEAVAFSAPPEPDPLPLVAAPVAETTADDIWGAFTTEEQPPAVAPSVEPPPVVAQFAAGLDVFEMINEESVSSAATPEPVAEPNQHTGSQWVPVEENTFDFVEEAVAEPPAAALAADPLPVEDASFGDISFEDDETMYAEIPEPAEELPVSFAAEQPEADIAGAFPTFEELPAPAFAETIMPVESAVAVEEPFMPVESAFSVPVEPVAPFESQELPPAAVDAAPQVTVVPAVDNAEVFTVPEAAVVAVAVPAVASLVAAAAPVSLTEDQLRAALADVSKEVIERIVWEVVPDLAEILIKEAIRKIRDGI